MTSFQALDVAPPIKQAVMVPRGATSSTDIRTADWSQAQTASGDRLFKIACLFCLSPLPFVCCIWNEVLLC